MTGRYVVLLRGINVNPATRIAMADLRALVSELGYTNVTTLLQSGNVVLDSAVVPDVARLEAAILATTGVTSRCVVLPLADFRSTVRANPLVEAGRDLSRLVITFFDGDISPAKTVRIPDEELGEERLEVTSRAIYQWCPEGILRSRLGPAFWKQFGPLATARNVRTANRILELAESPVTDSLEG